MEGHEIGSDPILATWNRGSVMECGGRDARRKALHRRHRFRAHEEDAEVLKCVQAFQSGVALTLAAALHDAIAGFAIGVNFSGMPFVRLSACVFHRSARLEHFTLCSSRMRVIQMQGSPSRLQDGGVYVTGAMRISLLRTEVRARVPDMNMNSSDETN